MTGMSQRKNMPNVEVSAIVDVRTNSKPPTHPCCHNQAFMDTASRTKQPLSHHVTHSKFFHSVIGLTNDDVIGASRVEQDLQGLVADNALGFGHDLHKRRGSFPRNRFLKTNTRRCQRVRQTGSARPKAGLAHLVSSCRWRRQSVCKESTQTEKGCATTTNDALQKRFDSSCHRRPSCYRTFLAKQVRSQGLRFGATIHAYGGQVFLNYTFETNFSGHSKLWGATPPNDRGATGL